MTTGKAAYYIGKPNPLMMRHALRRINCESKSAVIIGDRMDTDIIAGIESGLDTVLVLSGVTTLETLNLFPYGPKYVFPNVGSIIGLE